MERSEIRVSHFTGLPAFRFAACGRRRCHATGPSLLDVPAGVPPASQADPDAGLEAAVEAARAGRRIVRLHATFLVGLRAGAALRERIAVLRRREPHLL
jgi:hypothetical protein